MQTFVRTIATAMGQADPAGRELYRQRARQYNARLAELDRAYRRALAGCKRRQFVTSHAAFGAIARRYGLQQVALFGPDAHDFGPQQLERVVGFIREHGIKVILAEPQFPTDPLQVIARQTGAVIRQIDPLGNPTVPGHDSYLALMRTNLNALVEALNAD